MHVTSTFPKVIWNPRDYAANSAAQLTWARELIAKLHLRGDECILDVGCGDGKITAELARALPRGSITGVDASIEMLRFSAENFPRKEFPNLRFVRMDARELLFAQPFDIIFSNAALHWVDDHPAFLRSAAACLKTGGRLIISCGGKGNAQEMSDVLRATIRAKRWRVFFRDFAAPYSFHRTEDYGKWLRRFGFKASALRLANKDVEYADPSGLCAWLRTTWLPYTQRIPGAQREQFIADVVERYVAKHPFRADGKVIVHMVRLEVDAVKIGAPFSDPVSAGATIETRRT